jgi:hypothetical protein
MEFSDNRMTTLDNLTKNSVLNDDLTGRFTHFLSWCEDACDGTRLNGNAFTLFVPSNDSVQLLLGASGLIEADAKVCHRHHMQAHSYVTEGLIEAPPYRKKRVIRALNGATLTLFGQTVQGATIQDDPLHRPCVNLWCRQEDVKVKVHVIDQPYACYV